MIFGRGLALYGPDFHLHDHQGLPQFIVEFPGDSFAFLLLGREELGGQAAQAGFALPQDFFQFLACSDVKGDAADIVNLAFLIEENLAPALNPANLPVFSADAVFPDGNRSGRLCKQQMPG
jgi:hypothetical protein